MVDVLEQPPKSSRAMLQGRAHWVKQEKLVRDDAADVLPIGMASMLLSFHATHQPAACQSELQREKDQKERRGVIPLFRGAAGDGSILKTCMRGTPGPCDLFLGPFPLVLVLKRQLALSILEPGLEPFPKPVTRFATVCGQYSFHRFYTPRAANTRPGTPKIWQCHINKAEQTTKTSKN